MSSPTTYTFRAGNVGGFVYIGEFCLRTSQGYTGLVIRTFHDLHVCVHVYIPFNDSEDIKNILTR